MYQDPVQASKLRCLRSRASTAQTWDLYKSGSFTLDERLHPGLGLFRIVNLSPRVSSPQPVHLAIFVAHRMIILNAV